VEAALENVESILRDAGASLRDVVRCGLYVADLGDLPRVNAVYERVFHEHKPTRTTVGVKLPGYDIEIDCIAVVP
jgi:2-iminobutanoate/2-iminopropanoate deaminase